MKQILTLFFSMNMLFGMGQNLAPNPTFEDTLECPISLGDFGNVVSWSPYAQTADYFHTCNQDPFPSCGVPSNWYGFQYPRSGNAYYGMMTFAGSSDYREIIGAELLEPLIAGQKYYASLNVCAANEIIESGYGSNKLGFRFLNTSYSLIEPITIDNFAHIYSDTIVLDTLNWVRLFGSFVADSAYTHVAIGNFFDAANTDTINWSGWETQVAYYFIDDVCISTDSTLAQTFTTGIVENTPIRNLKIYPNPARRMATIEFKYIGHEKLEIFLFDSKGRLIQTIENLTTEKITIDTSNLASGMYCIQLSSSERVYISEKLIVE